MISYVAPQHKMELTWEIQEFVFSMERVDQRQTGSFALLISLINAHEAASAINVQVVERFFVAHLVYLPPEVTDLRLPILRGDFRTVQSRYQYTSADLPCNGCFVTIPVHARRFA